MSQPAGVDEVDAELWRTDGMIQVGKTANCRHGAREKCTHCVARDPFDEAYLHDEGIKHMSLHAYMRKMQAPSKGRGSVVNFPLENVVTEVKSGCGDHRAWPNGICTKCRPRTITLMRQPFRHVDNISFENDALVNRFLDFWRRTGHQRVGLLIGRYEVHADVPLGIKAVVAAIYEPPQTSTVSSVRLLDDPNAPLVADLCKALKLRVVGWIFTDLASLDKGGVQCSRNPETYLLSAEECITAATFQNQYPSTCPLALEGVFGSKFVTVVASGDSSNQVHFSGYQVSNQCAALVRAKCLLPTNGCPELAYVRDKAINEMHFLLDVQYKEKDKYGNEVSKQGRPLPVEYLLVDVPAGMPKEPHFTFRHATFSNAPFAVENREVAAEFQTMGRLHAYCAEFSRNQFLEAASDLHVLLFLLTNTVCPVELDELAGLLSAVVAHDRAAAADWFDSSEAWRRVQTAMAAAAAEQPAAAAAGAAAVGEADVPMTWRCAHCTFDNVRAETDCGMCGLPPR